MFIIYNYTKLFQVIIYIYTKEIKAQYNKTYKYIIDLYLKKIHILIKFKSFEHLSRHLNLTTKFRCSIMTSNNFDHAF